MSGEETSDGSGHRSVESKVTPTSTPKAVITEDAEPIYVNERRDTTEAPPLVVGEIDVTTPTAMPEPVASTTIDAVACEVDPASDATVPTPAIAVADQVASQRGVRPIRVPPVSKRYEAVAPAAATEARGPSRRTVIAASSVAGVCIFATIGAIAWARSEVTGAEQVPPPAAVTVAPAQVPTPAPAPAPVAEPPQAAPSVCSVRIAANTKGAALSVNGVRHGTAPAVVQLPCNADATIELRHPRYEEFRQVIAVRDDLEVEATLEREKTTLTVWSEPAGAEVTYNGTVLGTTPLVAKVPRYEQGTVWFRAPGYEADWRRITPKTKQKTVSIKLKGRLLAPPS